MTHPKIIELADDRRLQCPTPGCVVPLAEIANVRIAVADERVERLLVCFDWECPMCGLRTELVIDPSEGCWTQDGELLPSIPPE